jgi:hypothetical protein
MAEAAAQSKRKYGSGDDIELKLGHVIVILE